MKTRLGLLYRRTKRYEFSAVFCRFGTRTLWDRGKAIPNGATTVLLKNVHFGDELVADHAWIREPDLFLALPDLKQGEHIKFKGIVDCFAVSSDEIDFHITKIGNVRQQKRQEEAV